MVVTVEQVAGQQLVVLVEEVQVVIPVVLLVVTVPVVTAQTPLQVQVQPLMYNGVVVLAMVDQTAQLREAQVQVAVALDYLECNESHQQEVVHRLQDQQPVLANRVVVVPMVKLIQALVVHAVVVAQEVDLHLIPLTVDVQVVQED
jgi:hypothetical protein